MKLVSLAAALLAALLLWVPAAHAQPQPEDEQWTTAKPACFAHSPADIGLAQMAAGAVRWTCDGGGWDASAPVSWIRFDRSHWSEPDPRFFFTRVSRFENITIAALDGSRILSSVTYAESDGVPHVAGPIFTLALPRLPSDADAVVVRIAGPHNVPMVTEARLTTDTSRTDWSILQLLFLAMVLGMLVTPLLFDINFYRVLRERFVLLHAYMTLSMILYVLFAGGLLPLFMDVSVVALAIGASLSWVVGIAASAFFMREFVEEDALPPWLDRALQVAGWWTLIVIGFASFQFRWTQGIDDPLYFYAFIPVIAIYVTALAVSLRNGSRAARFVAVAWFPLIIAATERLMRGLGVYAAPSYFDQFLHAGLALEVVVVALGVSDKYLALRRERDSALAEAQMLENLSERDPLTGLLNRRALDDRFAALRREGYESVALFDLDHFKQVNDTYGHGVGDAVLRVVGDVLRVDKDAVAVRMGGEEFLVLFAGTEVEERAEAIRQTIAVRVAREVEALNSILTASVGLVHAPATDNPALDFAHIYRRADALLYEAKEGGRNLLASETLSTRTDEANVTPITAFPAA